MSEEGLQAVYNFDGAELQAIFEIKKEFITCMVNWDLEQAFWKVRLLRMELDAKLVRKFKKKIITDDDEYDEQPKEKKETEKEYIDGLLLNLENKRIAFNTLTIPGPNDKAKYYLDIEFFYMELCYLMKKHGIYFREGEDSAYAILKR